MSESCDSLSIHRLYAKNVMTSYTKIYTAINFNLKNNNLCYICSIRCFIRTMCSLLTKLIKYIS